MVCQKIVFLISYGKPPAYFPFVKKYTYRYLNNCNDQKGIYYTIDQGDNWNKASISFDYTDVGAIYSKNDSLYFGVKNSLFISTDYGKKWIKKLNLDNITIKSIIKTNNEIIIGSDNGGIYSYNLKQNLIKEINTGLTIKSIDGLYLFDSVVVSSVKGYGLYINSQNFTIWNPINKGLICSTPLSIASIKGKLLTNDSTKLYLSENNGTDWFDISPNYSYNYLGGLKVLSDSIIYLTVTDGEYSHYDYNVPYSIHRIKIGNY